MPTKPRLITTASAILIVAVLVIVGAVTKAQTSQTNTQVILNLENGQQYFGVPTCTKATITVNQQVSGQCTLGQTSQAVTGA